MFRNLLVTTLMGLASVSIAILGVANHWPAAHKTDGGRLDKEERLDKNGDLGKRNDLNKKSDLDKGNDLDKRGDLGGVLVF